MVHVWPAVHLLPHMAAQRSQPESDEEALLTVGIGVGGVGFGVGSDVGAGVGARVGAGVGAGVGRHALHRHASEYMLSQATAGSNRG